MDRERVEAIRLKRMGISLGFRGGTVAGKSKYQQFINSSI